MAGVLKNMSEADCSEVFWSCIGHEPGEALVSGSGRYALGKLPHADVFAVAAIGTKYSFLLIASISQE